MIVDAGGFSKGIGDISQLQTEYLVKGMSWLGYSAINLAVRDFNSGGKFVTRLQETYRPEFVSTNIFYKDSDKRFSKPYVLKELEAKEKSKKIAFRKLKVGIIGLCDERATLFSNRLEESALESKAPLQIAADWVPEVRKKADLLILLYNGTVDNLQAIIDQVPGIDVAILGGESYISNQIRGRQNTVIVTTPSMGKYVGVLSLELNGDKKIISSKKDQYPLDEQIVDDPRFAALAKEYDQAATQSKTNVQTGAAKSSAH